MIYVSVLGERKLAENRLADDCFPQSAVDFLQYDPFDQAQTGVGEVRRLHPANRDRHLLVEPLKKDGGNEREKNKII